MPTLVPAAGLCREFYVEVVAPALTGLPHAAGLLGAGSDVLGYDSERSTDHDWGPRASVFVAAEHLVDARCRVAAAVPSSYRGWAVQHGARRPPLEHHVTVEVWSDWLARHLGVDASSDLQPLDWLLIPQQRLLEVVAGPVFADPRGELTATRRRLAWYPTDVWWWLLACQWRRLAQEEPLVQRTAEVGDDLGSAVVTAYLVRESMRLALLMARQYAPYAKWLGTAFARLDQGDGLSEHLMAAVSASNLRGREAALSAVYQALARRHAALAGATAPALRPFHDRPAMVLGADRFVADCLSRVEDPSLQALPLLGAIDQLSDSTDLLTHPEASSRARWLYRSGSVRAPRAGPRSP